MKNQPTPEAVLEMARVAGVAIDATTAQRIVRAIGPGLDGFAPTAAALPFDCEPSGFRLAQKPGSRA
jgi:hypothetical protein